MFNNSIFYQGKKETARNSKTVIIAGIFRSDFSWVDPNFQEKSGRKVTHNSPSDTRIFSTPRLTTQIRKLSNSEIFLAYMKENVVLSYDSSGSKLQDFQIHKGGRYSCYTDREVFSCLPEPSHQFLTFDRRSSHIRLFDVSSSDPKIELDIEEKGRIQTLLALRSGIDFSLVLFNRFRYSSQLQVFDVTKQKRQCFQNLGGWSSTPNLCEIQLPSHSLIIPTSHFFQIYDIKTNKITGKSVSKFGEDHIERIAVEESLGVICTTKSCQKNSVLEYFDIRKLSEPFLTTRPKTSYSYHATRCIHGSEILRTDSGEPCFLVSFFEESDDEDYGMGIFGPSSDSEDSGSDEEMEGGEKETSESECDSFEEREDRYESETEPEEYEFENRSVNCIFSLRDGKWMDENISQWDVGGVKTCIHVESRLNSMMIEMGRRDEKERMDYVVNMLEEVRTVDVRFGNGKTMDVLIVFLYTGPEK